MKQLATVVAGLAVLVLALATGALAGTPGGPGAVYALTNSAQGNAVAVYDRSSDGQLSSPRFYPTAGLGSGAGGLGSQGGVALTTDGHLLLAVNAGSNTVSAFAVTARGLQLLDVVPSFGTQPVSIALRGHVAFVVNATSLSIHGYSLDKGGLTPIAGSGQALSPNASTPSQIAFAPNGVLVVTERGSNTIDSFTLDGNQVPSAPKQIASVGNTPFGFDFAHGNAIVSDANAGPGNSAATSYAVGDDGTVTRERPARADRAGCRLLARHVEGRPVRVHRQRRQRHHLDVRGGRERRAHARADDDRQRRRAHHRRGGQRERPLPLRDRRSHGPGLRLPDRQRRLVDGARRRSTACRPATAGSPRASARNDGGPLAGPSEVPIRCGRRFRPPRQPARFRACARPRVARRGFDLLALRTRWELQSRQRTRR